jgi:hypothetical protein
MVARFDTIDGSRHIRAMQEMGRTGGCELRSLNRRHETALAGRVDRARHHH